MGRMKILILFTIAMTFLIILVFSLLLTTTYSSIFQLQNYSSKLKFVRPNTTASGGGGGGNTKSRQYPVIRFAYLISASKGDVNRVKRLVRALYHPGNYYLIHMDKDAPGWEHLGIAEFVSSDRVFGQVGNVWIVGNSNLVTYRGPTMVGNTLHAMAIFLRGFHGWDWFINLSASDYPLLTQDDLIDVFSELPRDVNFVQHSSRLGWKANKRGKPIMIDPGLYGSNKSDLWWVTKQRALPTAFKLYTGSAWMILSRSFAEYCILGYENLPRTLLLYYTNFVSSPEGYFQTTICNSPSYKNTTVNHDLHYIAWDNPPRQHPRSLGLKDYRRMVLSNRPFARKFKSRNPAVLDKIDRDILKRSKHGFSFGGWCDGATRGWHNWHNDGCEGIINAENYGLLKPGMGAERLRALLRHIVRGCSAGASCCSPGAASSSVDLPSRRTNTSSSLPVLVLVLAIRTTALPVLVLRLGNSHESRLLDCSACAGAASSVDLPSFESITLLVYNCYSDVCGG